MIITDKEKLKRVSESISYEKAQEIGLFRLLEANLKDSVEPGAAIAAIQIDIPVRAVYIDYTDPKGTHYQIRMLNPEIRRQYDPIVNTGEGCLSLPGEHYNTDRWNRCLVSWYDYDENRERSAVFSGFLAIVVQHEIDHINGILMDTREHHSISIGRNDPCDKCLIKGIKRKWKKCKEHNLSA